MGKVFRTEGKMDSLSQPPDGFHSVLGVATEEGPLNYDELVVYDEAAILPCAALSAPPLLGDACGAPFFLLLAVGFCLAGSGRVSPPHGSRVAAAAGSR